MNDHRLKEIVNRYGTPIYIYDSDKVRNQYESLKESMPECFDVFFSMKANPLLGMCQLLKELGSNIEVASEGELLVALKAGFQPQNIIFTSPGKTLDELEFAIETDIYSINAESISELEIINEIAARKQKKVNVAIRINPNFDISGASIKMSGVPTQFGVDHSKVVEGLNGLSKLSNINLFGIHVYTGTQVLKAENIVANMEETIKMALELSRVIGFKLEFLDLGGGFGIPYFKGDVELDKVKLKEGMAELWEKYKSSLANVRIGIESGRYILAEAGVFLTKVLYTKETKGSRYVICDGGSNFHANSAFLGRHIRNNFPMRILGKEDSQPLEVNTVGPLCTPTDVIGQKVMFPQTEPGDLLIVEKSGAYGLTNSPLLFLSHPQPAEVMVYDREVHVLRERGSKEDFLRKQNSLF